MHGQGALGAGPGGDEGATALVGPQQAVLLQHGDGLAYGDAGDGELTGQQLVRRQPVALFPVAAADPAPQQFGKLGIQRQGMGGGKGLHQTLLGWSSYG